LRGVAQVEHLLELAQDHDPDRHLVSRVAFAPAGDL